MIKLQENNLMSQKLYVKVAVGKLTTFEQIRKHLYVKVSKLTIKNILTWNELINR